MAIVKCFACGKEHKRKPSDVKSKNYCSRECFKQQITKPCEICGKEVTRCPSWMLKRVYCSKACSKIGQGQRMSEMNKQLNKDRMTLETRTKLRNRHLGTGTGKTYEKTFSRHTHRIVAEQMLGRPLKKGEVVHHEDENKRNNDPSNLIVFASQAEHAAYHQQKLKNAR